MKVLQALWYECLKLCRSKMLLLLLPLVIIANGILFYTSQLHSNPVLLTHRDAYQQMLGKFRSLPMDDALEEISGLKEQYDVYAALRAYAQLQGRAMRTPVTSWWSCLGNIR